MKKFWVAIVSVFVLLGGVVFSACGKKDVTLSLSSNYEEICINANGEDQDIKVVTASVGGVDEGRVSAASSNQNVVVASVVYNVSSNQNTITLKVPTDTNGNVVGNEGTARVVVTSLDDSRVTQIINVNVYSDIRGMDVKSDGMVAGQNPFYAVKGGDVELDYSKLITFTNGTRENCRKDIVWSLVEEGPNASINGNILHINAEYAGQIISVKASSLHDPSISTTFDLNVLDKIDEASVKIGYAPNLAAGFQDIDELEDGAIRIVPNVPTNERYNGYIRLSFAGTNLLDVSPIIRRVGGDGNQIIRADRVGEPVVDGGRLVYTYRVFAVNENVNGDSRLSFNIKYSDYEYSVTSKAVEVRTYEQINKLNVYDDRNADASLSNQLIYTSYQNGYGKLFNVELLPVTVVAQEGRYTIQVDYDLNAGSGDEGNIINEQTLRFYYRSRQGNILPVAMHSLSGSTRTFVCDANAIPLGITQIYVIAGFDQVRTSISNVKVTFISVDNEEARSTVTMNLYRSATALNFESVDEAGLAFLAPTDNSSPKEIVKSILLRGQSNIVGLSTQYTGEGFTISNPFNARPSEDGSYVTFDIRLTITTPGVTSSGSYRIVHENGIQSASFDVSLFLPLTEVNIAYDTGSGNTSVNDWRNSNTLYIANDRTLTAITGAYGLSEMLIQSSSTIPVEVTTNSEGNQVAEARVEYQFLDKTEKNADRFANMSATDIYNSADLRGASAYLGISAGSITTNGYEGQTYIVASFTGRGVDEDKNATTVTFVRIIKVEVHVAVGVLSTAQNTVTIYAGDSVNDEDLKKTEVSIALGDRLINPVTYGKNEYLGYFSFRSTKMRIGGGSADQGYISWQENYYSISNINSDGRNLTFTIVGNTTNGNPVIADELMIEYEYANIYRRLVLKVTVLNADRIEKVEWRNQTNEGLYFEVNSAFPNQNTTAVLVMGVSPTNAKDQSLSYFITDRSGNSANFVKINEISNRGVVNLNATIGATGYIYVMPTDAYNGTTISYLYEDASGNEQTGAIETSMIGRRNETAEMSWFDYLTQNAYFRNNDNEPIYFKDILVRIPVTVADGKSWDTAYRLYDSASFAEINSFNYYIVMNSVVLNNWKSIGTFQGGIKGADKDVTITLAGNSESFINVLQKNENTNEGGEVLDLTFSGEVAGNGFVANKNYGNISNVKVDVYLNGSNVTPSKVTSIGDFAGSIVGENYGKLDSVEALGVSIEGGKYVGGLAGKNSGNSASITRGKVEFYTFAENTYNTLKGKYVGGLVGISDGGNITLSYAYDYTISNRREGNLISTAQTGEMGAVGAFVGYVFSNTSIETSFAVVNLQNTTGGAESGVSLSRTDTYLSWFTQNDSTNEWEINSNVGDRTDSDVWAVSGDGFYDYVNGGKAHLREVYQEKEVTQNEVDNTNVDKVKLDDRYYQMLGVGVENHVEQALAFFYTPSEISKEDMSSNEINALTNLNTISLSQIFGDIYDRLVVTSSNVNIIQVTNDSLIIKNTGKVTLKISSKQNYLASKTISINVIYALSQIQASWSAGATAKELLSGNQVDIQRESSMFVAYSLENQQIYLGTTRVDPFEMENNKQSFVAKEILDGVEVNSNITTTSGNILTIQTTSTTKELSEFKTYLALDEFAENSIYANAIKEEFSHNFRLHLFEGAIRLSISAEGLPITPSEVGVLDVELVTNNASDYPTASISLDGVELVAELNSATNVTSFHVRGEDYNRIDVSYIVLERTQDETGKTTIKYRFSFAVSDEFKNRISSLQEYTVTIFSESNVRSESFTLKVNKQNFTNLDIRFYQTNPTFVSELGITQYVAGNPISVVKPGDVALMVVSVNPTYAYYDYFDVTVSGSPNANAVSLGYMKRYGDTQAYVDGTFRAITGGIRVTEKPTTESELSRLVFKIWINPNVAQDCDLKLTITFYQNNEIQEIDHASQYLSISYLAEPTLSVNGQTEDAIMAKGTTVPVVVEVNYDQTVDLSSVTIANVQNGITLSSNWNERIDEVTGRKIYESTLTANVNSSLREGSAGQFVVFARISRVINGVFEWKEQRVNVRLVNFMLEGEGRYINANIVGQNGNNALFYIGLTQSLTFDYNFDPASYNYDASNATSVAQVARLNELRADFNKTGFYNEFNVDENLTNLYSINYNERGEKVPLWERISYWSNISNGWEPIYNTTSKQFNTAGGNFEFTISGAKHDAEGNITNPEDCTLMVTGIRQTATPTNFRLETLVQNGAGFDHIAHKEYYFTMESTAYSSRYLPLLINNEEDFENIREGTPQDYILMNDIVLENYTPFSTDAIRSLDGNGHTIYINSFNTRPENTNSAIRLALFDEVKEGTTLQNIRVNLHNGGQIVADISTYSRGVEVAGFALTNSGIITNCEVVSFYREGKNTSNNAGVDRGINVKFVNGQGNETEATPLNDNSTWRDTRIAGFVLENTGNITNSRVGGDKTVILTSRRSIDIVNSINQELETFNIIGQGYMAGFVLNNTGTISSAFVKDINMRNKSNSTTRHLSGFVGTNNGKILSSYVEGVREETPIDTFCRQGSSLTSALGVIAGFVYQNNEYIKDCYTNILITNNRGNDYVYLASGFVYNNDAEGHIENCYSASQVTSSRYSQMNFTGVSIDGEIRNNGTYENNYYYSSSSNGSASTSETDFATGATRLVDVSNENYFYGFAMATNATSNDGVWYTDGREGIKLVEPNIIAISNRYEIEDPNNIGGEAKTYLLPYSMVVTQDRGIIDSSYGSRYNPIIIRTAQEFNEVMGSSTDSDIAKQYRNNNIFGSYRLVDDIDLNELITSTTETTFDLSSTNYAFTGNFYGNGFAINNLSIGARDGRFAFGMFASIEGGVLLNFNLSVNQVINNQAATVGAIAGLVRDAQIVNVEITSNENSRIEGRNFVGGLAGMVFGNSRIKNISIEDVTAVATRFDTAIEERESVFTQTSSYRWRLKYLQSVGSTPITQVSSSFISDLFAYIDQYSYSYTGGLIGYADVYVGAGSSSSYQYTALNSLRDYSFSTLRVSGDVNVMGQVAGGVIGYQGVGTYIMDAGLTINGGTAGNRSHIVGTKFYAGGVIGQANSALSQIFAEHESAIQSTIENNIFNYYNGNTGVERGALDLFGTGRDNETYSQEAVGGLIGLVNGGSLVISYSKVNVVSNTANYAGGVIGKINTNGLAYYRFHNGNSDNHDANYLLNEVYATGDVRARYVANPTAESEQSGYAGGVVGFIATGSKVALMSVNTLNMFSTYNYATRSELTTGDLNVSQIGGEFSAINVYAIAGVIEGITAKVENGVVTPVELLNGDTLNPSVVSNMLSFVSVSKTTATEGNEDPEEYASVGFVQSYGASPVTGTSSPIKALPYYGYRVLPQDEISLKVNKEFYINNYTSFTSAQNGSTTTLGAFLGSGVWNTNNWNQLENLDLYPRIRYTVAEEIFVWLDAYESSIEKALSAMRSSRNLQVRVRGYASPTSSRVENIDIRRYLSTHSADIIESFSGTIIYKAEYTNYSSTVPKIILDRPLIDVTGEGFTMTDVTFELSAEDDNSTTNYKGIPSNFFYTKPENTSSAPEATQYSGAIVNRRIDVGNINNVRIIVKDTIHLYPGAQINETAGIGSGVGLLAPVVSATNLDGVTISNEVRGSDPLMTVHGNANALGNVGLITGAFLQHSTNNEVSARNFTLNSINSEAGDQDRTQENALISFTNIESKNTTLNIGGFVGLMQKLTPNQSVSINDVFDYYFTLGKTSSSGTPYISLDGLDYSSINVGGQVGSIIGLANTNIDGSNTSDGMGETFRIGINVNSNITNLNAGLLVGYSDNALTITGPSASDKLLVRGFITSLNYGNATNAKSISNGNIGGAVGSISGDLRLSNASADVRIDASNNSGVITNYTDDQRRALNNAINDLDNQNIAGSIYPLSVTSGNIGGLVGQVTSSLTFVGGGDSTNTTKINESHLPMSIDGSGSDDRTKIIKMGGIAGYVGSAEITGYISANPTLIYNGPATSDNNTRAYIGGLVGQVELGASNNDGVVVTPGIISGTTGANGEAQLTQIVRSQIFTNGNAVVGGIVGQTPSNFTVQGTAFGGAHKILGGNAVTFGGTVGSATGSSAEGSFDLVLKNNINYGDVFIINKTQFNQFYFGGLLGMGAGTTQVQAGNNISLVTNHNETYFDELNAGTAKTMKALFGYGVKMTPISDGSESQGENSYKKVYANLYNHAVSMATDDQATEIAYNKNYNTESYRGYGDNKKDNLNIINAIKGSFSNNAGTIVGKEIIYFNIIGNSSDLLRQELETEGSKLSPILVDVSTTYNNEKYGNINSVMFEEKEGTTTYLSTNGIKYYVLDSDLQLDTNSTLFANRSDENPNDDATDRTLKDIALIGDSFTLSYEKTISYADIENNQLTPLIKEMQGYAFVSGLNVEANIDTETLKTPEENENIVGGLVNTLTSGKIYSVGVYGNMSLGGTEYVTVGGLVGISNGGLIEESNASVNIVYRGATWAETVSSNIGGLIGNASKTWIRYSYSAGSIYSYTGTNIFALTFGDTSDKPTLDNSYTVTHLEKIEVTKDSEPEGLLGVAYSMEIVNGSVYSQAATESSYAEYSDGLKNSAMVAEVISRDNNENEINNIFNWKRNYSYNFNYPIRGNIYTHASSYYIQNKDEIIEQSEDEVINGETINRGIMRYGYSRVATRSLDANKIATLPDDLNKDVSTLNYYYGIPNAEVLHTLNNAGNDHFDGSRNFVILNNINMSKAYGNGNWTTVDTINTPIKLDGNGKAVKKLPTALFSTGKGIIENLRIVEAEVNDISTLARAWGDNVKEDNNSATSNEPFSNKINNISVQGSLCSENAINIHLNNQSGYYVGGMIAGANNTIISNCTNLVSITSQTTSVGHIGGIVGALVNTSEIIYSSNNATIIYDHSSSVINVGGIAGNATKITYSYNTAGIAVNYTNAPNVDSAMHVGGISGMAETVENCYNTGLVKVGTKAMTRVAYVGGIVGYSTNRISNCLNEASVEGRSLSSWWFDESVGVDDDTYYNYFAMKQGDRYLNVYGIGFATNINNCKVGDGAQIVADGNGLKTNSIMYVWNKLGEKDSVRKVNLDGKLYNAVGLGFYSNHYYAWGPVGDRIWGWWLHSLHSFTAIGYDAQWPEVSMHEVRNWLLGGLEGKYETIDNWNPRIQTYSGRYKWDSKNRQVTSSDSDDKIEYKSFDNYGFPRAINFRYNTNRYFIVGHKPYGVSARYPNYSLTGSAYYHWSAEQLDKTISDESFEKSNYSNLNLYNSLSYEDILKSQAGSINGQKIGVLVSNIDILNSNTTSGNDWNTFMDSISGVETNKGESISNHIFVAGEPYYLANEDTASVYNVLNSGTLIIDRDVKFDITTDPNDTNGVLDLHSAVYYTASYAGTDTALAALLEDNVEVYRMAYSKYNSNGEPTEITFTLRLLIDKNADAVSKNNGIASIDKGDQPFVINYKYDKTESISFADATYTYNLSNGQILIDMSKVSGSGEDGLFELPNNDVVEPYYYKNVNNEGNETFELGTDALCKVKYGQNDPIYLVYNQSRKVFTYSKNIYRENGDFINTQNLKPEYFQGKTFDYYSTIIAKSEPKEINIDGSYKNSNIVNSLAEVRESAKNKTGNISFDQIKLGETSDIVSQLISKDEIFRYNDSNVKIIIAEKLGNIEGLVDPSYTYDIYLNETDNIIAQAIYERGETIVDPGDAEAGVDPTIEVEYNLKDVVIVNSNFEVIVDSFATKVTLSKDSNETTSSVLNLSIEIPSNMSVSEDNTNAIKAAFNGLQISEGTSFALTFAEFTQELDHYENVKIEFTLPDGGYRSAIESKNRIIAKYENDNWSLVLNQLSENGYTADIALNNDKVEITATTLDIDKLALFENAFKNFDLYKQLFDESVITNLTYLSEEYANSEDISMVNGIISYSYTKNYNYNLETDLSYTDESISVNGKLERTANGKQVKVGATVTPTKSWGDFKIYTGTLDYNKDYTVSVNLILDNLKVSLTNNSSDYAMASYSNFKVDNSVKNFSFNGQDVGNQKVELTSGQSLTYEQSSSFTTFEIENYKLTTSYLTLESAEDIVDSETKTSFIYNKTLKAHNDSGDYSYIINYGYNQTPRIVGGQMLNGKVEYEVLYDNAGNVSRIDWYAITGKNLIGENETSIILSYLPSTGEYWRYYGIIDTKARMNNSEIDDRYKTYIPIAYIESPSNDDIKYIQEIEVDSIEDIKAVYYYDDSAKIIKEVEVDKLSGPSTETIYFKDESGAFNEASVEVYEYNGMDRIIVWEYRNTDSEYKTNYYVLDYCVEYQGETRPEHDRLIDNFNYVYDSKCKGYNIKELQTIVPTITNYNIGGIRQFNDGNGDIKKSVNIYFEAKDNNVSKDNTETITSESGYMGSTITMPEFSTHKYSFDASFVDVNIDILDRNGESVKNSLNGHYRLIENEKSIVFDYKVIENGASLNNYNNLYVQVVIDQTVTLTTDVKAEASLEAYTGIILQKNINFGQSDTINKFNINLLGNDHFISYITKDCMGFAFINKLSSGALIKDLMCVGQANAYLPSYNTIHFIPNGSLFVYTNSGEIRNISLYGNIRNLNYNNGTIAGFLMINDGEVENISINATLNGLNAPNAGELCDKGGTVKSSIYAAITDSNHNIDNVNFSGIIAAGNGGYTANGINGTSGKKNMSLTPHLLLYSLTANGGNGKYTSSSSGAGGGIGIPYITSCENALLILGNGGNGGHSGDGGDGIDLHEIVNSNELPNPMMLFRLYKSGGGTCSTEEKEENGGWFTHLSQGGAGGRVFGDSDIEVQHGEAGVDGSLGMLGRDGKGGVYVNRNLKQSGNQHPELSGPFSYTANLSSKGERYYEASGYVIIVSDPSGDVKICGSIEDVESEDLNFIIDGQWHSGNSAGGGGGGGGGRGF